MAKQETNASVAEDYYDNDSVAAFYRACWGGSDIHIGKYDSGTETVAQASRAMTRHLLDLAGVHAGDRVLDISCGYGGTLRELAKRGCRPSGIDISMVCVKEARKHNLAAGLADRIGVDKGDFHAIASAPESWDAVICQESLIHSNDRPRVFAEVFRVLRPGGIFAFSDILTGQDADISQVERAFERLAAQAGATPGDYRRIATEAGFGIVHAEERPSDIRTHYDKLAARLAKPVAGLTAEAAGDIAESIDRWRTALAGGNITWACFIARKPG